MNLCSQILVFLKQFSSSMLWIFPYALYFFGACARKFQPQRIICRRFCPNLYPPNLPWNFYKSRHVDREIHDTSHGFLQFTKNCIVLLHNRISTWKSTLCWKYSTAIISRDFPYISSSLSHGQSGNWVKNCTFFWISSLRFPKIFDSDRPWWMSSGVELLSCSLLSSP